MADRRGIDLGGSCDALLSCHTMRTDLGTIDGYALTYRGGSTGTAGTSALVDGSMFRPDTLGRLDRDALGGTMLPVGRESIALGELFEIEGSSGDRLTIQGAPPLDYLGAEMAGGELVIKGDAGDELGASMRGGKVFVRGSAGKRIGGPSPTQRRGMTGGEIVVFGQAGECAGYRMRRGLIAITGGAGRSPGYRMLAGTIVIATGPMVEPGLGMKRGTICCLDGERPSEPMDGFARDGRFSPRELVVISLVLRRLTALGIRVNADVLDDEFDVWTGDALELNRGELWVRVCRA